MTGSWMVIYRDGSTLAQFDEHPEAVGGEVPMRCIAWPNVEILRLSSQFAETDIGLPEEQRCEYRLVQRTMKTVAASASIYLLLMLTPGYAYPFEQRDVQRALYWLPDGSTHDCPDFECGAVAAYLERFVWGRDGSTLPPIHEVVAADADAVVG
jgi:hypothetical protein